MKNLETAIAKKLGTSKKILERIADQISEVANAAERKTRNELCEIIQDLQHETSLIGNTVPRVKRDLKKAATSKK